MDILSDIIAGVKEDTAARQRLAPLEQVRQTALSRSPALEFPPPELPLFSLICEVKRSSPSKGSLAEIADPAALAREYQAGGAGAISVLTEQRRFHGSLEDLAAVRTAVDIPVLRKDFIVSEYHVYESRAYGADLVLLIVAGLGHDELEHLYGLTVELGMTPLIEVHTPEEAQVIQQLRPRLVGVNTRNLKDLSVDIHRFDEVARHLAGSTVIVGESGVSTREDIEYLALRGARMALVGEALVTGDDPKANVEYLTGAGERTVAGMTVEPYKW